MAGYIGSGASVVSSGAENKKVFDITTNTTSLTGLNYTVGKVHVYHNGVRLVDGTDFTATNSTSIALTVAAVSGDQVVVVSFASYQVALSGIDDQSNATAITIDSDENVGIGTANPTAKLNVAGATSGDYLAKIESTNQFGLKIKTTSTSDSHEQFAIHDGNNNVQFKVLGGGTVHATGINLGGSGAANRLEDYEEGTWTPTVTSSAGTITTVGVVSGSYTKIGNLVFQSFDIIITTNGTGSGILTVGGSPFTLPSIAVTAGESGLTGLPIFGYTVASNKFSLWKVDTTYPSVNGARFIGSLTYTVL